MNTCPFDENAKLIRSAELRRGLSAAGWGKTSRDYRIFFPKLLGFLRPLETLMTAIPFAAQYFVTAVRS